MHMISHPNFNTRDELPLAVMRPGRVLIVPRHLTSDTIDRAREYGDYADDPELQQAERDGGKIGAAVERERMRRWDDLIDEVAPAFTTRVDALRFIEQLHDEIELAWPS